MNIIISRCTMVKMCSTLFSTISSGYNALTAVILEDFIRPFCCKSMTNVQATWLSKLLVVLIGGICLALAFMVSELGSMILQLVLSLFGIFGGPLLGIFTLGMLFPWANRWGGLVGVITSSALLLWIGIGTIVTKTSVAVKSSISVEGCNWNISKIATPVPPTTTTILNNISSTSVFDKYTGVQRIYSMSFQWYTGLGMLTVVVIGMLVSLLTGLTDTKTLNPKLICPFFDIFFPCLPDKVRTRLRFGVRHYEDTDENDLDIKEQIITVTKDGNINHWPSEKLRKDTEGGQINDGFSPPKYDSQFESTKL